jgi:hypothetical protein
MKIVTLGLPAVLFAIASLTVTAQEKAVTATAESCLAFAQEFYSWYVPKAQATNDSLALAMKQRHSSFSAQLLKGVEAVDADAERHNDAGLDFDWILNSQDPGDPGDPGYILRDSKVNGTVCLLDAYRQVRAGKPEKAVIPELKFERGRWLFINFHYPDSPYAQNENLMSLVKAYLQPAPKTPQKTR